MNPLIFISLITLALSAQAQRKTAGPRDGGGGTLVACKAPARSGGFKSGYISVRLHDYDVWSSKGLEPTLLSRHLSESQNFEILMKELEKFSSARADLYRSWYREKEGEIRKAKGRLEDSKDRGDGEYPNGCFPIRVIRQQFNPFPEDKRYTIDDDILKELGPQLVTGDILAGLWVHEFIYREAMLGNKVESTYKIAYFNANLAAGHFSRMRAHEIVEILFELDLLNLPFDYKGLPISIKNVDPENPKWGKDFMSAEIFLEYQRQNIVELPARDVSTGESMYRDPLPAKFKLLKIKFKNGEILANAGFNFFFFPDGSLGIRNPWPRNDAVVRRDGNWYGALFQTFEFGGHTLRGFLDEAAISPEGKIRYLEFLSGEGSWCPLQKPKYSDDLDRNHSNEVARWIFRRGHRLVVKVGEDGNLYDITTNEVKPVVDCEK